MRQHLNARKMTYNLLKNRTTISSRMFFPRRRQQLKHVENSYAMLQKKPFKVTDQLRDGSGSKYHQLTQKCDVTEQKQQHLWYSVVSWVFTNYPKTQILKTRPRLAWWAPVEIAIGLATFSCSNLCIHIHAYLYLLTVAITYSCINVVFLMCTSHFLEFV